MDIYTIYKCYIIGNQIILIYSILNYSYKVYKTGKSIKNFIYKEKKVEKDWTLIDK